MDAIMPSMGNRQVDLGVSIPIPSGFKSNGFRVPDAKKEYYLHSNGRNVVEPRESNNPVDGPRLILEPIKPKTLRASIEEYLGVLYRRAIWNGRATIAGGECGRVHQDLSEILAKFDDAPK